MSALTSKWLGVRISSDIDAVMKLGYFTMQFTEHHYRIQDRVDYWPSREKWFDLRTGRKGQGLQRLIRYLLDNVGIDL